MSSPNQQSLTKLKRQWGQVFECGKMAEELAVFTDSSSAGVLMLGGHTMKAKSRAEAELYAAALEASEAKGVQSMMRDLGFAVKPVLNIDAKAKEHILHRQGIGKLKHIDVASYLGAR